MKFPVGGLPRADVAGRVPFVHRVFCTRDVILSQVRYGVPERQNLKCGTHPGNFNNGCLIEHLVCFIGLAPFVVLLGTLQQANQVLLAVALCGMGFFGNMAWGPFLALPAEIFSPEVYGKAMGFVNGAGYFVAAFSAKIFAALVVVDASGHKTYTNGWFFIAFCVVAGIVAASFIRTTGRAPTIAIRSATSS